jgi:hypothetical protein
MSKIGSQNIRGIEESQMRRLIFPDLRYGASTVPVRTRMSRVLCGEMSGVVYICSREKTYYASAGLDLQQTRSLGTNLTIGNVKWWRREARLMILIPYAFLLGDTFSRLRRVDGASQTAYLTESAPRWGLAFRVRPGKWRFDHI